MAEDVAEERAPTPPSHYQAAIRAYLQGEALCDAGRAREGIASFQKAFALAWELDTDEWPAWATEMRASLAAGGRLLADDTGEWDPRLAASRCACERDGWWRPDAAVQAVASALRQKHFAVLDGFVGGSDAARLREACISAWRDGRMKPARDPNSRRARARTESIAWEPDGVELLSARTNALLASLREACPELLGDVICRQRAMVSRYGLGDAFARHIDNTRDEAHGNGRLLTSVYYMQAEAWDARGSGGCLRIFHPQAEPAGASAGQAETAPLVDVAPLGDRLVIFLSDARCPHEVLPVVQADAERFAATIWYWGPGKAVPDWWVDGVHDRTLIDI